MLPVNSSHTQKPTHLMDWISRWTNRNTQNPEIQISSLVQVYIKLQISKFQVYFKLQISNFNFDSKLEISPSNLKFAVQTRNFTVQTRNLQAQTRNFAGQTRNLLFETRNFVPKLESWMSTSSMYWFKIDNPGLWLGGKFQVSMVNFKFGDTHDIPKFKFELNSNF